MVSFLFTLISSLWPLAASFSSQSVIARHSQRHSFQLSSSVVDSYLRWHREGDTWNMQTAVTSFQQGNKTVELHAQLHFAEPSYYEFWNSDEFNNNLDHVHYELLVDDELLQYKGGAWRLEKPIMASPTDKNLARSYGWECQASQIDYCHPKWIHADLTRQEFLKLANKEAGDTANTPLWKLAGPEASSTAAEAVSALLVGPPTLSYSQQYLKRKLFTNLFLEGEAFANSLRALLWMTVPAPELSIILLDWSSLLKGGSNPSALSEVAMPILSGLVKLNFAQIRRFLFGQVIVSSTGGSNNKDQSSSWSLLVTKRNDRALDVLEKTLSESLDSPSTALLYGSSHCPDLHSKLRSMGYKATKTTWRTAWSVKENEEESFLPAIFGAFGIYLIIGALDWVSLMGDFSQGWIEGEYLDCGAVAGLYLLRHVLLYLGLSKFLVDWTNKND